MIATCAQPGCGAAGENTAPVSHSPPWDGKSAAYMTGGYYCPPGWDYTCGPDVDETGATGMRGYPIVRRWCPEHPPVFTENNR